MEKPADRPNANSIRNIPKPPQQLGSPNNNFSTGGASSSLAVTTKPSSTDDKKQTVHKDSQTGPDHHHHHHHYGDKLQQSNHTNNNVLTHQQQAIDMPSPHVQKSTSSSESTDDEKQKFDKYVAEYAPTIALFFVTASVVLQMNHTTVADQYLKLVAVQSLINYFTCWAGVALFFHCMWKKPCPRTAMFQFPLMVLGLLLILSSMTIRTYATVCPTLSGGGTMWVTLIIASAGFGTYIWSATRLSDDNRQNSVTDRVVV